MRSNGCNFHNRGCSARVLSRTDILPTTALPSQYRPTNLRRSCLAGRTYLRRIPMAAGASVTIFRCAGERDSPCAPFPVIVYALGSLPRTGPERAITGPGARTGTGAWWQPRAGSREPVPVKCTTRVTCATESPRVALGFASLAARDDLTAEGCEAGRAERGVGLGRVGLAEPGRAAQKIMLHWGLGRPEAPGSVRESGR